MAFEYNNEKGEQIEDELLNVRYDEDDATKNGIVSKPTSKGQAMLEYTASGSRIT